MTQWSKSWLSTFKIKQKPDSKTLTFKSCAGNKTIKISLLLLCSKYKTSVYFVVLVSGWKTTQSAASLLNPDPVTLTSDTRPASQLPAAAATSASAIEGSRCGHDMSMNLLKLRRLVQENHRKRSRGVEVLLSLQPSAMPVSLNLVIITWKAHLSYTQFCFWSDLGEK